MEITVVNATRSPVATALIASENMVGHVCHNADELVDLYSPLADKEGLSVSDYARQKFLSLGDSKLSGPLEFIHIFLQVEGVPRWFTHQMVRTRVGATYSQVSMRFTDPTTHGLRLWEPGMNDDEMYGTWEAARQDAENAYKKLVELGMPLEDARGILPNGSLTSIGVDYALKTLVGIGEVRLCFQAQSTWKEFMKKTKEAIIDYYDGPFGRSDIVTHPGHDINDLFQVACQRYGKCTFNSAWDRPCPIKERHGW